MQIDDEPQLACYEKMSSASYTDLTPLIRSATDTGTATSESDEMVPDTPQCKPAKSRMSTPKLGLSVPDTPTAGDISPIAPRQPFVRSDQHFVCKSHAEVAPLPSSPYKPREDGAGQPNCSKLKAVIECAAIDRRVAIASVIKSKVKLRQSGISAHLRDYILTRIGMTPGTGLNIVQANVLAEMVEFYYELTRSTCGECEKLEPTTHTPAGHEPRCKDCQFENSSRLPDHWTLAYLVNATTAWLFSTTEMRLRYVEHLLAFERNERMVAADPYCPRIRIIMPTEFRDIFWSGKSS